MREMLVIYPTDGRICRCLPKYEHAFFLGETKDTLDDFGISFYELEPTKSITNIALRQ